MTEPKERKARPHGETWDQVRRLYLKYPLLAPADLARIMGISRARVAQCVVGLTDERNKLHEDALKDLKRKEGL
jgi:hypothetical protein